MVLQRLLNTNSSAGCWFDLPELIQLHDYPSCANSKDAVLAKHFVGG